MNQFVGIKNDGTPFLALVLEPGNLTRLQEAKPIRLRVDDLFPNGIPGRLELLISFTETPVADARELAKLSDVVLDERTPRSKETRPHCPECKSTLEQFAMLQSEGPITTIFCPACGCSLGVVAKASM